MTVKEYVRFPLRLNIDKNKEIDEAVHQLNMKQVGKVSKHQFILDAIDEKIQKQRGQI